MGAPWFADAADPSLGLRWLQPRLSDLSHVGWLSGILRKTLLPIQGEIEVATGHTDTRSQWRRKIGAPFRAAGQLLQAAASYAGMRLGGPIRPQSDSSPEA